MLIANAASPSNTFWENLTMVLIFNATSPTSVPAATTAPVVSIVPPSQAPVTSWESPSQCAMYGIAIIIGIAVISTSEITYESFFVSPLMAPAVAIAADTPQIETALDIMRLNSSSTFNFLHNQKAKY